MIITFQGQKFDDDLGLDYIQFKWRNHDPQIGRFIEIDPLSDKYVYNSTYAFSENKVTSHIELEGLEAVEATKFYFKNSSGVWQEGLGTTQSVDNPYNLGSGTLYHIQVENGRSNSIIYNFYVPPTSKAESWLGKVWDKITSIFDSPQIMVFGSAHDGSESPGSKPDYSRPIETLNLGAATDLMNLLTLKVIPNAKDISPDKAVGIMKKYFDNSLKKDEDRRDNLKRRYKCDYCGDGNLSPNDTPKHQGPFKKYPIFPTKLDSGELLGKPRKKEEK